MLRKRDESDSGAVDALSILVTLSIFRGPMKLLQFLTPCYLFSFYVIISPYKCTRCTHHKHNPLSWVIVRTLSAPIYLSNSPGVFGHRAILTMGDRTVAGVFLIEQADLFYWRAHAHTIGFFWSSSITLPSQPTLSRPSLPDVFRLRPPSARSPCLVTFEFILHLLATLLPDGLSTPFSRSFLSDVLWIQPPSSHSPLPDDLRPHRLSSPSSPNFILLSPDGILIQHHVPASRFCSEVTVCQTRHSISMCSQYVWTSLAHRLDIKKVHISLLIIPRLNFTSLHSRPATPTMQTSTAQTADQQT